MNASTLALTRFQNRTGVVPGRADDRLHRVRIRRSFKTREEAIAEKATQELSARHIDAGIQSAIPFLSTPRPREAGRVRPDNDRPTLRQATPNLPP